MIATILSIICAAFFKAVADTLVHHFDTSVFKWKDRRFWDPSVSSSAAHYLKFTKYKLDAWHLANSAMIISFFAALAFDDTPAPWWVKIICAGGLFNLSFNQFYNHLLRK